MSGVAEPILPIDPAALQRASEVAEAFVADHSSQEMYAAEQRDDPVARAAVERFVSAIRLLVLDYQHHRPTQWAYDRACEALHKHKERADRAEAELAVYIERESADAAAGSYALRVEKAEAERDRLARELHDLRAAVAHELPPIEHINTRLAEFPAGGEQNYLELARDIWQILDSAESGRAVSGTMRAPELASLFDRIEAALTETQGHGLDEQAYAVRAAVARHERAEVANGEPTLFEVPDDGRAHRLVASRLSEVTLFVESECREVAGMVLHTLEADGFVLGRRRHAVALPAADGGPFRGAERR